MNRYKRWCLSNPDRKREIDRNSYHKHREARIKTAKVKRENCPEYALYHKAKNRAKKKNLPFDINIEDIVIPDYCPVLGIKLCRSTEYREEGTPSLDRIIPKRGYVKGNIHVISWRANRIKNDGLLDEFKKLVKYLSQLQ